MLSLTYWLAVNDLGVDKKGSGSSKRLADEVVDIIRSSGGKAVANYGKTCSSSTLTCT